VRIAAPTLEPDPDNTGVGSDSISRLSDHPYTGWFLFHREDAPYSGG